MREDRLKFKEINELDEWLQSLINERDITTNMIADNHKKLTDKEYDENSDIFNPTTKEKLTQELKELENSMIDISTDMGQTKQKRKILREEKKNIKSKYKKNINSIRYKSNKTKYANIEIGEPSLGREVVDIKYKIEDSKDFMDMYVEFKDGSVYTASIGLDKEPKINGKL